MLQRLRGAASAALAAAALLLLAPAHAQPLQAIPDLSAPVTDTTGTLTPDQVAALDAKLRAFATAKGSQVAVLVVATTRPEEIEQYGIRYAIGGPLLLGPEAQATWAYWADNFDVVIDAGDYVLLRKHD